MEYPAQRRVLHAPLVIVFMSGINLILIQWILVRELTALLLGTELVVLLVSVAYFAGFSVGYWASAWVKRSWFIPLGLLTLGLHLSLPIWFRLLVVLLDSHGAYWAAFFILPVVTPFLISAFYSVLLPLFADEEQGQLPSLYTAELLGSGAGVVGLVILGGMDLTQLYLFYSVILLMILGLMGLKWQHQGLFLIVIISWLTIFPDLNNWSNTQWFQQLRSLPQESITLFSAYSPYQKIDVLQDYKGDRYLYLDGLLHFGTDRWSRLNVIMGSVAAELAQPENSLVIGAGSMQLERLIAEHGGAVTTVELDPVVVEASTRFFADYNLITTLSNRSIIIADAKHFVANTSQNFDLIATDVPAAFSIQTASLYSVPFYEQIAAHLEPDGVLVVNLTTRFRDDNEVAQRITASLLAVFDDVMIVTSESSKLSYAFAGQDLPFDFLQLQSVLERNGETEYAIYQRPVIEYITGDARVISLDTLDIALAMSMDWIADRFAWR